MDDMEKYARLNQQRKDAVRRYLGKQETITIHVSPAEKTQIRAKAESEGLSVKKYIVKKCLES